VSTFGGAEIGCRVAERVLEITTRPDVTSRVGELISLFDRGLSELRDRQPYVVEVRQSGLVIGLRVDHPNGAVFLQQELYELGVWAIASGFDQSVLQFKPGLLLDDGLAASVLERLETALARARETNRPVPSRHVRSPSLSR
jgi:acetylornithine/succinyldiaminopimelate/putrescine aminotransferase